MKYIRFFGRCVVFLIKMFSPLWIIK
jgi:hypothetical protein